MEQAALIALCAIMGFCVGALSVYLVLSRVMLAYHARNLELACALELASAAGIGWLVRWQTKDPAALRDVRDRVRIYENRERAT